MRWFGQAQEVEGPIRRKARMLVRKVHSGLWPKGVWSKQTRILSFPGLTMFTDARPLPPPSPAGLDGLVLAFHSRRGFVGDQGQLEAKT